MSACIIPAGPEFQDPPGIQNSPPFVFAVSPLEGFNVVDPAPTFSVRVSDLNLGDDLWIMWIFEYPNTPSETRPQKPELIKHSNPESPIRDAAPFSPTCGYINNHVSSHQVMAAISDREFIPTDDNAALLTTKSDKMPLVVTWTWQKTCPGGTQ